MVQQAWNCPIDADGMVGFHRKLVNTKMALRQWSRQTFGNIFQGIKEVEELLRKSEEEFDTRWDEIVKGKLGEARAGYARALAVECEFWW